MTTKKQTHNNGNNNGNDNGNDNSGGNTVRAACQLPPILIFMPARMVKGRPG
jgi:hypothetical protein